MKKLKIILVLLLSCLFSFAQERKVHGVVKDETGLPLPGANIIVKGTTTGTQSDLDGRFEIKAKAIDTLVFSFISYVSRWVISSKNEINVVLKPYDDSNDCIYESSNYQIKRTKTAVAYYTKGLSKRDLRKFKKAERASKRDLKNSNNPKYNFKKAKNSYYIIYKKDNCYYKKDQDFQQKYKVAYSLKDFSFSDEYVEAYNKLVFKYLNKKFKKTWQSEIRKDVFALDEFLK